jgi:hypothetical protein
VLVILWAGGVAVADPAGGPLTLFAPLADTEGTLSAAQLRERIDAALPDWYQPVHVGLALLTVAVAASMLTSLARTVPGAAGR